MTDFHLTREDSSLEPSDMKKITVLIVAALTYGYASAVPAAEFQIPLFISASKDMQQGFIRIINHSEEAGVRQRTCDR